MDWKTLERTAFQVLWCSTSVEKRPAPLQIRPFTSDSYKAIKERERRKSCRRVTANIRSEAESHEAPTQPSHSAPRPQTSDMHFLASDFVSTSYSGAFQEGQVVTPDQHNTQPDSFYNDQLSSPGAVSDRVVEGRPSGEDELSTPFPTTAISIDACDSDSAPKIGPEHGSERNVDEISDRDAPFYDYDHTITNCDDVDIFPQRSNIRTCCDTEVQTATSRSWSAEVHGRRYRIASAKQLAECHGTGSPSLKPLNSTLHVAMPWASLKSLSTEHTSDVSVATMSFDEPSHEAGVVPSQEKSEQNGSTEQNYTPPRPWARDKDELLLHLRNTAQLNWASLLTYFPGMPLGAVKRRYKHLNTDRETRRGVADEPKSQVQRQRPSVGYGVSLYLHERKKDRMSSTAKYRRQPASDVSEPNGIPCHRRAVGRLNNTESVKMLANSTPEDASRRTSRSGRLIRHPFRHRLSEGYL